MPVVGNTLDAVGAAAARVWISVLVCAVSGARCFTPVLKSAGVKKWSGTVAAVAAWPPEDVAGMSNGVFSFCCATGRPVRTQSTCHMRCTPPSETRDYDRKAAPTINFPL